MIYRIRFHPLVARDLDAIAQWINDYAGSEAAARKLAEIEAAIATLKATPHKGSLRDEIAPGLRAIPAGRKAVVAFVVDDDAVIPPFLTGCIRRTYAAIFSFCAGVTPPMPMFGRSLL